MLSETARGLSASTFASVTLGSIFWSGFSRCANRPRRAMLPPRATGDSAKRGLDHSALDGDPDFAVNTRNPTFLGSAEITQGRF
jgi:hypothetical protein